MMKKNIYLLIILLSLVGCKDFLEETSQDLVRPSQVTDLEQILLGDGYGSPYYSTTIFTDEQASTNLDDESFQSTYDELKWLYTWNKDMFTDAGAGLLGRDGRERSVAGEFTGRSSGAACMELFPFGEYVWYCL